MLKRRRPSRSLPQKDEGAALHQAALAVEGPEGSCREDPLEGVLMGLVGVAPSREVAAVMPLVVVSSGTTRPTAAYVLAPPSSSPCIRGTLLLSLDCPVTNSASALLFTPFPCHLVTTHPLTLPPIHTLSPLLFSYIVCWHLFTCSIFFLLLFVR